MISLLQAKEFCQRYAHSTGPLASLTVTTEWALPILAHRMLYQPSQLALVLLIAYHTSRANALLPTAEREAGVSKRASANSVLPYPVHALMGTSLAGPASNGQLAALLAAKNIARRALARARKAARLAQSFNQVRP